MLLTRQRRMGKTSVVQELGRRLKDNGWIFLSTDVEGATCAEDARRSLERLYAELVDNAAGRITDTLDVLVHDGYLEAGTDGYRFPSRLLKDWWAARFRDHHIPLESRRTDND